jgi:hypothetical protein
MTFEIDPCKSILNNTCDDDNINTMNNLCYEISNAYGNVYGSDIQKKLEYKCSQMISDKKKQMGKSDCNLRRPPPPPIFNQIPHYFPSLLTSNNPEVAYKKCLDMANSSRYPNSTKKYCKLDADALVIEENQVIKNIKNARQFNMQKDEEEIKEQYNGNTLSDCSGNIGFSLSFYIGIIIVFISIFYMSKSM